MAQATRSREEYWHSLTHGAAAIMTLIGIPIMMRRAIEANDPWNIFGCAIFGATMVATFSASALYHGAIKPKRKRLLRIADHSSIFMLICLSGLRNSIGWWLLGAVWSIALFGFVFKLLFTGKYERFSTALYLGMGWMATLAVGPMLDVMLPGTLIFLVCAGACFTIGTIFYSLDRRGFHLIWHLLVIAGCALLWTAVFNELPIPA